MVSRWISFDNCNSGANSTGVIVCIQRDGLEMEDRETVGSRWIFYFVVSIQTAINITVSVGCILLARSCLQIIYRLITLTGSMKLYQFIAMVIVVMMLLSQLPIFHSLRHINLGSLLLCLGLSFLTTAACIYAGGVNPDGLASRNLLRGLCLKGRVMDGFRLYKDIEILGSVSSIDSDIYSLLLARLIETTIWLKQNILLG